jgi:hypothetical protein
MKWMRSNELCAEIRSNECTELNFNMAGLVPDTQYSLLNGFNGITLELTLDEAQVELLVQALEENTSIKSVTLMNCYDEASRHQWIESRYKYVEWPVEVLLAIGKLPNLECIYFRESAFNEIEIRSLCFGLIETQALKRVIMKPRLLIKSEPTIAFDSTKTYASFVQLLSQLPKIESIELGRSPPLSRRSKEKHLAIPLKDVARAVPLWDNLTSLTFYELRNTKANDEALASLGRALEQTKALRRMSFDCYRSARAGSQGLACLMQSLSRLPNLSCLDFSHSLMNEADASAMARAVRDSQSLKALDLTETFKNCDWYKNQYPAAFLGVLLQSPSLEHLQLQGSYLNDSRLKSILLNLKNNYVVESIGLNGCEMPHGRHRSVSNAIRYYTRLNKAGRKVMRDESSSLSEMVESLIQANDSVPILYHLLTETPNKRALFEAALLGGGQASSQKHDSSASSDDSSSDNDGKEIPRKRKRDLE